jgi:Pyridoxal-phosphate dependent enzyme
MRPLFREDTPIERYRVGTSWIRVKRDDQYAAPPAPPLGKLRGAMALLETLYVRGVRLVGCWDTRVSALGQGIAVCCRHFPGMRAIVAFPKREVDGVPVAIARAESLGAEILPVVAARITISFAEARREVERRKGVMLPFGLECPEAVASVARAAATVPAEFTKGGTVVVSVGSGVTLAGMVRGLVGRPAVFVGVSSGRSVESIGRCLARHGSAKSRGIRLIPASEQYSVPIEIDCPFPSHPNYDRKAWRYAVEHASSLPSPLFFWNVGA